MTKKVKVYSQPFTIEMVRAGRAAYERWNEAEDEVATMVTDVFFSMLEAQYPNSSFRQCSKSAVDFEAQSTSVVDKNSSKSGSM